MDPLTIATSIFGLLKATAQVANYLGPYVSAAKDTPKIVAQVHSEVVYTRTILLALDGLTKNLASVPVKRTALIQVDQLVAVFTDGVLLFSELEAALPKVPSDASTDPTNAQPRLQSRLRWVWKQSTFSALLTRLQGFKGSISLMLTILQRQVYLTWCSRAPLRHFC
jgi:cell division control protein 24